MNLPRPPTLNPGRLAVLLFAALFFAGCLLVSWNRWANFEYRTFDLAFYLQALWQLLHGRFHVSLLNVPMLGNHADPVVFLLAPLFALVPHPMLLPAVQIAALAGMAPVGWRICRRLGMGGAASALMAMALLLAPATGYAALHEFHPEAFSALFLLLMFEARLRNAKKAYWLWFLATLACKENMALLLAAYCAVESVTDRERGRVAWSLLPGLVAACWFVLYTRFFGPALNSGNVEFAALYRHLGSSPGDIAVRFFTQPGSALGMLRDSLTQGNLVWGLLLPFLALPLLRPLRLAPVVPLLLQHLLSWRSSEWMIYFHYAAPLIPFFWMATAEAVRKSRLRIPALVVAACVAGQIWTGPARAVIFPLDWGNAWKSRLIEPVAADGKAAVVASLSCLSHLALREQLYSLHHLLKGLKTLSRTEYLLPDSVDAVVIDYADSATFDPGAGYYHPVMRSVDGRIFPSSDRLLHEFLRRGHWSVTLENEMALYRRGEPRALKMEGLPVAELGGQTQLMAIEKSGETLAREIPLRIRMVWSFRGERTIFPWMILRFKNSRQTFSVTKGLCMPEGIDDGLCHEEEWRVMPPAWLPGGNYSVEAVFIDNTRLAWARKSNPSLAEDGFILKTVPLGNVAVRQDKW